MIAFKTKSKSPKVFLPIINMPSIIKTFKYLYLFLNIWRVSSLDFSYLLDFTPYLTERWNAECNVIPLIPVAAFLVDAVTRINAWSKFWFGNLRTHLKYSFIALIIKLFPTPAHPLKNIWNGLGGNSLFFLLIYNALHTEL